MKRQFEPPLNGTVSAFLNTTSVAYLAVDSEGLVVEWSPLAQELFGWKAEDIVGRDYSEFPLPDAYCRARCVGLPAFIRKSQESDLLSVVHYLAINSEGEEFPVEIRSNFGAEVKARRRIRLFISDLRPRLLVEERMIQAAKMEAIGELVSGLAHDFNNILGVIRGSLETLELRIKDPLQRELIQLADGAAERGREITRAMLAVARREPQREDFLSINQALLNLQPLLKQSATRSLSISIMAEAAKCEVKIDRNAFDNAMLNFVINARDAMPDGGIIFVYTQNVSVRRGDPIESVDLAPGDYIVVGVDDNGSGMPAEVLARAMEPFFTTKPKNKGTGLGLSMAYALARQSHGALRIRSALGKGTSIHLFIPLVVAQTIQHVPDGPNS